MNGLGTSQPDPVMRHHQGGGLALRARGRQPPLHQCTDAASVLTRKCIRGHSPTRLLDGPGLLRALPAPGVGAGWGYLHLWHKGSASITRAESLAVNAVVSSASTAPHWGHDHCSITRPQLPTTRAPCSWPKSPVGAAHPWQLSQTLVVSAGQPLLSSALGRRMLMEQCRDCITASNEG